jgi:hypothetical protein
MFVIIWINGPFGAGKTTLSRELAKQLKPSLIFDPELLGLVLQKITLSAHDFQNIRLWRQLTGFFVGLLGRYYRGHVIVPMTVLNPQYLREIFESATKRGAHLRHFFLELDEQTLRKRIEGQLTTETNSKIQKWRLEQAAGGISAKNNMPDETIFISATKTVGELAACIVKAL